MISSRILQVAAANATNASMKTAQAQQNRALLEAQQKAVTARVASHALSYDSPSSQSIKSKTMSEIK